MRTPSDKRHAGELGRIQAAVIQMSREFRICEPG